MKYLIGLNLASDRRMKELNQKYRQKNTSTDVLSFNLNEKMSSDEVYLGDIIISLEKAKRQARERGVPLEDEFGELVKHGAMHLLGWDHD